MFASVLGFVTKNIEQRCEERNCSSHFLPSFRDQKPETTALEGDRLMPVPITLIALALAWLAVTIRWKATKKTADAVFPLRNGGANSPVPRQLDRLALK